jgi:hypothetical protein
VELITEVLEVGWVVKMLPLAEQIKGGPLSQSLARLPEILCGYAHKTIEIYRGISREVTMYHEADARKGRQIHRRKCKNDARIFKKSNGLNHVYLQPYSFCIKNGV